METLNQKYKYLENYNHPISVALTEKGFSLGRMISGSKSAYDNKYPNNEVYFNANIFIIDEQKLQHGFDTVVTHVLTKIFYGDLDLTRDGKKLEEIARQNKTKLFILYEHDGRFNTELSKDNIEKISKKIYGNL